MAEQNSIPAPPWTLEALGKEKYQELGLAFGILDHKQDPSYCPALDLTPHYKPAAKAEKSKDETKQGA